MELITYRKTLDVHKNGIQFLLQGFQTSDNMSRVIEISLMASGDAIDFPLERIVAMMYVTTPSATEPSINECTIKDNKVVYDVLPIVEEGITTMQLKLIETSPEGAKRVLASPQFSVEVTKSNVDDNGEELKTTFSAIEDFIAKADAAYGSRLERIELTSECIFKAYYYDGTVYETDILQKLFLNGNVELSKSYAVGGTGVRAGEDTDNSKYYSNVAKSESLNAKAIMENSEQILEEVKLHGMYTAFHVDFNTGEVEYVSPSFKFNINSETGNLDAIGQTYTFEDEIERLVLEWLEANKINIEDLQNYSERLEELKGTSAEHTERIKTLETTPRSVELGGTGASTKEDAIINLGIDQYQKSWNVDDNVGVISSSGASLQIHLSGGDGYNEDALPIFMKNSGQLYVSFEVETGSGDAVYVPSDYELSIYINDELYKSYVKSDFEETYSFSNVYKLTVSRLLLTVNKGDIVTFKLKGKHDVDGYGTSLRLHIENFEANVETPYTYLSIGEGTDEITVTDILNALTGGVK